MIHSTPSRSGVVTTVGATSAQIITIPVSGLTAALMYQAMCVGVDRNATANTVTYVAGQGGGINLGIITLLPNLFGGVQKSLSLLLANVSTTVTDGYIVMTVTGVAGRTIDWAATINVLAIEP